MTYKQCIGIKKNGQRCGGGAKEGYKLCGPHIDHPPDKTLEDMWSDPLESPEVTDAYIAAFDELDR